MPGGRVREVPYRGAAGHVGEDAQRLRATGAELLDGPRERLTVHIGHDDLHALGREARGERLAHAAAGTGDDGNLAGELVHRQSP
jgi:hypothetical protein